MDKLLDRLAKAVEREQMSPRKIIASGKLEGKGSNDDRPGRRDRTSLGKPVTALGDLKK